MISDQCSVWLSKPAAEHFTACCLRYCRLDRPAGGSVALARSQARHRYQLATERKGAQRCPRLKSDVGLGQIVGRERAGFGHALEGERKALAHAVVGDRQHIGPAQAEDEQHLDGPGADAAHFGEALDDVGVGHFADGGVGGHGAVEGAGGQVAEGLDLVAGDAGGAQRLVGRVEQKLRGGIAAESTRGRGDGWWLRPCRATAGRGWTRAATRRARARDRGGA